MTKFLNMFPELLPLKASAVSACLSYGNEKIILKEIMANNFSLYLIAFNLISFLGSLWGCANILTINSWVSWAIICRTQSQKR